MKHKIFYSCNIKVLFHTELAAKEKPYIEAKDRYEAMIKAREYMSEHFNFQVAMPGYEVHVCESPIKLDLITDTCGYKWLTDNDKEYIKSLDEDGINYPKSFDVWRATKALENDVSSGLYIETLIWCFYHDLNVTERRLAYLRKYLKENRREFMNDLRETLYDGSAFPKAKYVISTKRYNKTTMNLVREHYVHCEVFLVNEVSEHDTELSKYREEVQYREDGTAFIVSKRNYQRKAKAEILRFGGKKFREQFEGSMPLHNVDGTVNPIFECSFKDTKYVQGIYYFMEEQS